MAYNKELELNGVVIDVKLTNTVKDQRQRIDYVHKTCNTKRQYKNYCKTCDKIVPKEEIQANKPQEILEAELNVNKNLITTKPLRKEQFSEKPIRSYAIYELKGKKDADNQQLDLITQFLAVKNLILPVVPFAVVGGIERQAFLYAEAGRLFLNYLRRPSEIVELSEPISQEYNITKQQIDVLSQFFNETVLTWKNEDIYTINNLIRVNKPRKTQKSAINPLLAKLNEIKPLPNANPNVEVSK